ncbi:winged helix-turn-helix transcriptional regulator [Streptomyces sp. NPDC001380]|uniref:winged helix-turn-helix transcriptional regulator n=1 Tax=Streptomyces sp. NPDC001380 TaxID=3364566 RepID=UPI0036A0781B
MDPARRTDPAGPGRPGERPRRPRLAAAPTAPDDGDLCPCRLLLDRLGDRWSALALCVLHEGPEYHGGLRRAMGGEVSRQVLTRTLRALERDGLVDREVEPGPVLRVRYALTPLGRTLAEPLAAVRDWTDRHRDAVDAARAAYDARPPEPAVTELRRAAPPEPPASAPAAARR